MIVHFGKVDGYGGLIVLKHKIGGKTIHSLYGHLDLSASDLKIGDNVTTGQFLANLGENKSVETDGERKHLHFAIYEGEDLKLNGYQSKPEKVQLWTNPYDFFKQNGLDVSKKSREFGSEDLGSNLFKIKFTIPENWELEYIPSIQALNLFTLSGEATAIERSQIFIRYFDASSFLTLSTVKIHKTQDLKIGKNAYKARRYDIEKKANLGDFKAQPIWRNFRHLVTDFTDKEGFSRYYVIASNPNLDRQIYESILNSMVIENK